MESCSFFRIFAHLNNIVMNKLKYIVFFVIVLLSASIVSCDKYDTIVVGQEFAPYNSLVTKFRQLVYIEFSNGKARVWGPCANRVESSIDNSRVSIKSDLDSLVVFAYGFAAQNREADFDGNITIDSSKPYAIYLNGLTLNSDEGQAIQSLGTGDCYLVLPQKSNNVLIGGASFNGSLIIDGEGQLIIHGLSNAALSAYGPITCSFPVDLILSSLDSDGIHSDNGNIKIAEGIWHINAARNAFSTPNGQVILNGGQVYASAEAGSIVSSPAGKGLLASDVSCIGISAKPSPLETENARQFVWQAEMKNLELNADSLVRISVDHNFSGDTVNLMSHTPGYIFQSPWILISNPSLSETDDLIVEQKK